jgi:prepilin-type N-terminal cleavage/methylation domain-containing protein
MKNRLFPSIKNALGFSIIELLVVLGVIGILSAISIPYIYSYKKLYKSEDQALKVMDLMREAGQVALNKRRTMRFEIDLTDNAVLIIDENGTAAEIKKIPLEITRELRVDVIPATVTKPNPPNYTDITFAADTIGHLVGATTVTGHSVWAARFRSDGSVVNSADVPISVNIYCWPPVTLGSTTARNLKEIRAITLFGGSGAIRYWKYDGATFVASQ